MNQSKISWTDKTWNPTSGCSKVSAGCDNCYAETLSLRMKLTTKAWTGENASENVTIKPHKLKEPYALKQPSRVFVNSMSDIFHPIVPDAFIADVFQVMNDLPQHTFQILTKRPRRAAKVARGNGQRISGKARVLRIAKHCIGSTRFVNAKQRSSFYHLNRF